MRYSIIIIIVCVAGFVLSANPIPAFAVSQDDIAAANTDSAQAQAAVTAAANRTRDVQNGLRATFEATPEYATAKKALDDATAARDTEKSTVLDQLHGSADYQQAVTNRDNARSAVDAARSDGNQGEIAAAAMDALKASAVVTKMDSDALRADSEYQRDSKRYAAASATMKSLDDKFEASLAANPDWQRAKADLDGANANLTAALSKADALQEAWENETAKRTRASVISSGTGRR